MSWAKSDSDAEMRDATPEEIAEHRREDHPTNYKEAANRVRREQEKEKKHKGTGVGQKFDVPGSMFD